MLFNSFMCCPVNYFYYIHIILYFNNHIILNFTHTQICEGCHHLNSCCADLGCSNFKLFVAPLASGKQCSLDNLFCCLEHSLCLYHGSRIEERGLNPQILLSRHRNVIFYLQSCPEHSNNPYSVGSTAIGFHLDCKVVL